MDALESFGIEAARKVEAERAEADSETGQADFLALLVAQLENQDPLNPQESGDLAVQLAQFSQVEELVQIREGIDQLVTAMNGEGAEDAAPLEPTSLVGREVVVYGNQVEVTEDGGLVGMSYRTLETAATGTVRIYDANGEKVLEESFLPSTESGPNLPLPAGDHRYEFDPEAEGLEPGIYAIEFEAADRQNESFTVLPMVEGTVTGAILAGEPSIRIGNQIYSVADILEVRGGPIQPNGGAQGARQTATGENQFVVRQQTPSGPRAQ
ncbi:MAG: flagellar hook assembly protein FlgD [Myxococcota bacterium]